MFKLFKKNTEAEKQSNRLVFGVMLVAAVAALGAAFVLTMDKMEVLRNPDAVLSCTINAVLDCSRVMHTWQASVFGFPNMLIGMMAFPVVITLAVAGLAGVKFPRKFMFAAEIGILLGTLFSLWLFLQSVFVIQILCPWCLLVTLTTTLMLASITYYNLRENTFGLKKKYEEKVTAFLSKGYFQMVVAGWIVILTALVFLKFGADLFA